MDIHDEVGEQPADLHIRLLGVIWRQVSSCGRKQKLVTWYLDDMETWPAYALLNWTKNKDECLPLRRILDLGFYN